MVSNKKLFKGFPYKKVDLGKGPFLDPGLQFEHS